MGSAQNMPTFQYITVCFSFYHDATNWVAPFWAGEKIPYLPIIYMVDDKLKKKEWVLVFLPSAITRGNEGKWECRRLHLNIRKTFGCSIFEVSIIGDIHTPTYMILNNLLKVTMLWARAWAGCFSGFPSPEGSHTAHMSKSNVWKVLRTYGKQTDLIQEKAKHWAEQYYIRSQ